MGRRRAIAYDPNNKNRGKGRRRGKVSVDVDATNITGSVTFYGAPTPPDNGYIITSDSNTRLGISTNSATPIFWTADDSTIVNVVDGLPGNTTNITTTSQAFQYLADNDYYVMGPSSKTTPTDKLIFEVDARRVDSYPTTGDKWYDVSPNSDTMNYTTNNSNIEYEDATKSMFRTVRMTQADYYRSEDTYDIDGDFTMIVLAKVYSCHNGTANGLLTNHSHSHKTGAGITVKTVTSDSDFRISCNTGNGSNRTYHTYYGTSNIKDRWCHLMVHYSGTTLSLWVNGVKEYTRTYSMASRADNIDLFNWSTTYAHNSNYRPKCKIQYAQVYEKALTNAEISQSYHQGDIVTDGLTFAVDPSNLVSYESGSSIVYSLAGNNTGSLVNGASYLDEFGGVFTFDNSNDKITIPNSSVFNHTSQLTIESWVKFDGNSNDFIFEKGNVNTQYSLFSHGTDIVFRTKHSGDSGYDTLSPSKSTAGITNGQWHHIIGSWDGSTKRIYVDGILKSSKSKSGALTTTSQGAAIGAFGGTSSGYYFGGEIASVRIYNKGLSASEVAKNFNAQRSIFGL